MVDPIIESRALESRPDFFLKNVGGEGGGKRELYSLKEEGRVGVMLRSESESDDGKTRLKGTSPPSFFRSLSIFCLRRLLRDVMLYESELVESSKGMSLSGTTLHLDDNASEWGEWRGE